MRHFSRATLVLWSILAWTGQACSPGREPAPNIIVISLDTLVPSALRAYDAQAGPLPALDAFAETCVRFDQAISTASWTLPAHASLFTGLYPDRHGATDRRVTLPQGIATLAGALERSGYRTVAFNGGGFLDDKFGMGQGFGHYASAVKTKTSPAEAGPELVGRVRAFLAEQPPDDAPLFLFLHSYAVHNYYDARPEVARALGDETTADRERYVDCVLGRNPCPPAAWKQLEQLYRIEQELFDRAFGDLIGELQRAGIWDDAIVVLLSDHGEGFDPERNRIHHGGRLHGDQLRIPMLVRIPGLAPRAESTPVSLVDVMPTLLELAGADQPRDLDGVSLVPVLRQTGELAPRPLFAMEHCFGWEEGKRTVIDEVQGLPLAISVLHDNEWLIHGPGGEELYDAFGDPEQTRALDPSTPWAEALRALLAGRRHVRPGSKLLEADATLQRALDDLGYSGQ